MSSVPVVGDAGQVVLPVGPPFDVHVLAGDQGFGAHGRLVAPFAAGDEVFVVVGPGLVVVVDGGQVRIVEDAGQLSGGAARPQGKPSVLLLPSPAVNVLVLPALGIADARFGFHVVEPHVLGARPGGPDVLARDAARVAADALVQVQHHRHLRLNLHTSPPRPPFGPRSPRRAGSRWARNS